MKAPVPYPVYPGLPPRRAQSFTAVALLLTNGTPPPEWLIPELERLSPIIGYHRTASPRDEAYDKEMIFAAKNLEQHLRTIVIAEEEFELGVTDCVETVLISLPEVIEFLEAQLRPPRKGGQTPDGRKRVCAGVCADCAFRRSRPLIPTDRDQLFRSIATSAARVLRAPLDDGGDVSLLFARQARREAVPVA